MIVTKRGLIIPVKENIIIDNVPKVNLLEFVNKNKALKKIPAQYRNHPPNGEGDEERARKQMSH